MGLDLYTGPLTRYYLGDWQTIAQQMGAQMGVDVQIVRPQVEDPETDPDAVLDAVRDWQTGIGEALGDQLDWPEGPQMPYRTDKPDWAGYGAVVLLAAYDERPDLRVDTDDPGAYREAPAYRYASEQPQYYYSLLAGAQWWLPLKTDPVVIEAPPPAGEPVRMSSIDRLCAELRMLAERTAILSDLDVVEARSEGPPAEGAPVEDVARFGLAVMLELAEYAAESWQPLIMDY